MRTPNTINVGRMERPKLSRDGKFMVVSILISLKRIGGRKQVVTPANVVPWTPPPARIDSKIIKALIRAHRWRSMLESKLFASVRDLAKAEKINEAYLGRVLRLTLLSPSITVAILCGRQREELELVRLLKPFPIEWEKQEALFFN